MTQIELKTTPVFQSNKQAYDARKYRCICNEGSTRSSKSYSLCQLIIHIALTETKLISVVSHSLPHLKKGALRDFLTIMEQTGLYNESSFNKTDKVYDFSNGSKIEFFGVENSQKIRGPGRDILFINEANLIDFATYKALSIRTSGNIFLDYNPADSDAWVYAVADQPGNKLIHSTYKNNLSNISPAQIKEIESYRDADQNYWRVFGLGLRGSSSESIFTHQQITTDLPGKGEIAFGLDFGFNVQTALVKVEFYENKIFAKQLLYETKLTTTDLIERLKSLDIPKESEIFCDAAEPKTIEEISRAGYNVKAADKAVLEGIRKLKSLPLLVTSDSADLIKELKNYKWKVDNNGKTLDEPVKFQDHQIDALRYCVFTKLSIPIFQLWTV